MLIIKVVGLPPSWSIRVLVDYAILVYHYFMVVLGKRP